MEYLINNLPDKFLLIIIVIIFSGFIRGFLGFGSGLITIPILSFIYSPIFAVVFNIIIEIPTTIYLTFIGMRHCKFKEISPMFFSMILMIPIGTIFLIAVDEKLLLSKALEWQQTRGSRSGRVAWQFILDFAGKQGVNIVEKLE